jgi:hypothetical protein
LFLSTARTRWSNSRSSVGAKTGSLPYQRLTQASASLVRLEI